MPRPQNAVITCAVRIQHDKIGRGERPTDDEQMTWTNDEEQHLIEKKQSCCDYLLTNEGVAISSRNKLSPIWHFPNKD